MRRRLAAAPSFLLHFWRRSLQLRVVTATMLLGVIVVTSLGSFLYFRIADGLVQDRVRAARAEAVRSARDAQSSFSAIDDRGGPSGLNQAVFDIVQQMASTEDLRDVILLREPGQKSEPVVSGPVDRHGHAGPSRPTCAHAVDVPPSSSTGGSSTLHYEGGEQSAAGVAIGSLVSDPGGRPLRAVLRLQPPAGDGDRRPGPAHLRRAAASCWCCWWARSPTS